jgi:TRAP-type C4-dicarboxylate transport system substrate-binding protein
MNPIYTQGSDQVTMRNTKGCIFTVIIAFTLGVAPLFAQDVVLQIGYSAPVNSPWDLGLKKIASEWARISNGRVRIVFPKSVSSSGQEDLIQKLKFSLDGVALDTTGLGFIDNDIYMLSMPSVIADDKELDKALAATLPLIKESLGSRFEVLGWTKGGWLRFFSNKQIRTPDDLRNLRMGVSRDMDTMAKLMQSIGLRTVMSDLGSTLLQFNSGALDVIYSSPLYVGALWSQYRKVVTHMTAFKVSPFYGAILINKRAWDKVPDSLKPALRDAADRIAKGIGDEAVRLEDEAIASMQKAGLIVPVLEDKDMKAWDTLYADKVKSVIGTWYSPRFVSTVYGALGK